jgi:hypothetical protein
VNVAEKFGQGCVQRALRMVFVGDGRTEQREDAVSDRWGDVTAISLYHLHHQLQCGIDDGATASSGSRSSINSIEPLMSAKSCGDRLALALEIFRGGPLRYANLSFVGFACYVRRCCY